jgi:hypothetical protein
MTAEYEAGKRLKDKAVTCLLAYHQLDQLGWMTRFFLIVFHPYRHFAKRKPVSLCAFDTTGHNPSGTDVGCLCAKVLTK